MYTDLITKIHVASIIIIITIIIITIKVFLPVFSIYQNQ